MGPCVTQICHLGPHVKPNRRPTLLTWVIDGPRKLQKNTEMGPQNRTVAEGAIIRNKLGGKVRYRIGDRTWDRKRGYDSGYERGGDKG